MTYNEFLTAIIDKGIKSASEDPWINKYPKRLEGSRAGFEACRGKDPPQLWELLDDANKAADVERHKTEGVDSENLEDYWKARYFAIQVEFVCNTVSAMLANEGLPTIIAPTLRGAMNAARIIGVDDA